MLLLVCSLALKKTFTQFSMLFLSAGQRKKMPWKSLDPQWLWSRALWTALCYDTSKEWAFNMWNLLGAVSYSSEPVLSNMYSFGWSVIEYWRFVQILRKFRRGHMWFKEWMHGLTWKMAACTMSWVFKRQGLCLWACFGGIDGTYRATLGGQQLFF